MLMSLTTARFDKEFKEKMILIGCSLIVYAGLLSGAWMYELLSAQIRSDFAG